MSLPASALFDSVVLTSAVSPCSTSLVFSRAPSFPGVRYSLPDAKAPPDLEWVIDPPSPRHQSLRLELESFLGRGRTGLVYSARVIPPCEHADDSLPTHLCVKITQPGFCRTMAREAWMYEQMPEDQGVQGAIVPRFYGFFTSSVEAVVTEDQLPWYDHERDQKREALTTAQWEENRLLQEDYIGHWDYAETDHPRYTSSVWKDWTPFGANAPLVGILVTELLGEKYTRDDYEVLAYAKDLEAVFEDLSAALVYHTDIRRHNVLRAPLEQTAVCPRHGKPHLWRVIDFDRASKTDAATQEIDRAVKRAHYRQYDSRCFW